MNRLSRRTASLALAAILAAGLPIARAEESTEKAKEPPHYESPIVALLFLPVTVLLKIAAVVSPDANRTSRGESESKTEK